VVEHILVLLDKLISSQIAVLVEKVDLENLLAIRRVGIGKDVGDEEGEDISEGSVADVGGENVVVVRVKELNESQVTSMAVRPPP
jgi:hypothetical protein